MLIVECIENDQIFAYSSLDDEKINTKETFAETEIYRNDSFALALAFSAATIISNHLRASKRKHQVIGLKIYLSRLVCAIVVNIAVCRIE